MRSLVVVLGFVAGLASISCEPSNADYVSYATRRIQSPTGACPNAGLGAKENPPGSCPYVRDPVVLDSRVDPCCAGAAVQVWLTLKSDVGTASCMVQIARNGSEMIDNGAQCNPQVPVASSSVK